MRHTLLAVIATLASGCGPAPTTRHPPEPDLPDIVGWRELVRDRATASAYTGRVVRFELDRADCVFEGRNIRAWYGSRDTLATLIVVCPEPVTGKGPYTVVGKCGAPQADGVKRGKWIDFSVEVTATRITSAP